MEAKPDARMLFFTVERENETREREKRKRERKERKRERKT